MPPRTRADLLLVERGLFDSRAKAQAAIAAGLVTADDAPVRKASEGIGRGAVLRASPAHPWVSRGGIKLAAALDHFGIEPKDRICLDVGASTGGFTDVLLARGARSVVAVDVGHGQLHPSLQGRREVIALEGTDIRHLRAEQIGAPPDLIVIDVSFISLAQVLTAALSFGAPRADMIALIKPQFEAGRAHIKKGIVRDAAVHAAVCDATRTRVEHLGWIATDVIPSPVLGGDGNREFLLGAGRG